MDDDFMNAARHILLVVMLVLTLPWGAVLRVAEAGQVPVTPDAQQVLRAEPSVRVAPQQGHRCRTAVFPGAVCSFNALLPAQADVRPPAGQGRLAMTQAEQGASRFAPSPEIGPPRPI
ncbi:hypothetical protein [Maritimibacter sp. DP1N21-5]|uniref:hypothetical protein n=1 Tax=Maritimibacter sp. DP1N21-5 TaxID=2836867 RepID=UPI001C48D93E|nr:hypothetical protein [Maritimibacter sp. DP1N21-5]MBV7409990.1 hypothetical protein [Maritimibacter sp. DP1N21-5]